MKRRVLLLVPALAVLAGLAASPTAAAPAISTGVASRLRDFTAITPTAPEHDAHPKLKLVSAMATWALLEPTKGTFDWKQMDANVKDARAGGYKIIFRVMAGGHSPHLLYTAGGRSIPPTDP